MRKLVTPAPTNEAGTCILCGATLRWYRIDTLTRKAATPEQLRDWPVVHVYSGIKTTKWTPAHGYLEDMRYEGSHYAEDTFAVRPEYGRGLQVGSSWRTGRGDDMFCNRDCAIGFARIAANVGFRLPSMTPKERRAWRRHMRFIQELAPFELEPTEVERAPHPTGPRQTRRKARVYHRYVERRPDGTLSNHVHSDPSIPAPGPEEVNQSRWQSR